MSCSREYDIRPYRDGDEHGIIETFNLVFGRQDESFRPRTLDDWRWAFADNPGGMRVWVAERNGSIVAQFASQPHRVRVLGRQRVFAQIIDSMVHPDHRRGLKRPGLFVETALPMVAATCGPNRDLVTYGWPNSGAWRIGRRFVQYQLLRREKVLAREPGAGALVAPAGVEEVERAEPAVLDLYERCAGNWGASAIRDKAFLDWRLCSHPRKRYRLFVVRDSGGGWAGYAAYRAGDWPQAGSATVVDWLVPPGDVAVGAVLRETLLAAARADGAQVLLALFPGWSPWFERFQEWGFLVHGTPYPMSARNYHPSYGLAWLRDHWWYQPLEIDLF